MSAVQIEDVWFAYPSVPVLCGVTAALDPGERVALLGRNGAGKTTLTKLLMALLEPDRGAVVVAGHSTAGRRPEDLAAVAAYVFQHPEQQLFARTVMDEVAFGPQQVGVDHREVRARAADALRRVGLDRQLQAHAYDLTPADRKLVTVAAALAQRPQLLIIDEPTHGLDRVRVELLADIVREQADAGVAILAVSHDLGFVAEAFDRALVLAQGVIAYDGKVRELMVDERRLRAFGLEPPPVAMLSLSLGLSGTPVRIADVAQALERWCRRS